MLHPQINAHKESLPFLMSKKWEAVQRRIPGRAFPSDIKAESASHSEAKFRDAISAEPSIKEKDPFAEVLVNSRWRGRESNP
jgi:hypothetical protein